MRPAAWRSASALRVGQGGLLPSLCAMPRRGAGGPPAPPASVFSTACLATSGMRRNTMTSFRPPRLKCPLSTVPEPSWWNQVNDPAGVTYRLGPMNVRAAGCRCCSAHCRLAGRHAKPYAAPMSAAASGATASNEASIKYTVSCRAFSGVRCPPMLPTARCSAGCAGNANPATICTPSTSTVGAASPTAAGEAGAYHCTASSPAAVEGGTVAHSACPVTGVTAARHAAHSAGPRAASHAARGMGARRHEGSTDARTTTRPSQLRARPRLHSACLARDAGAAAPSRGPLTPNTSSPSHRQWYRVAAWVGASANTVCRATQSCWAMARR